MAGFWRSINCVEAVSTYAKQKEIPLHALIASVVSFLALVYIVSFVVLQLMDDAQLSQDSSNLDTWCRQQTVALSQQFLQVNEVANIVQWFVQGALLDPINSTMNASHFDSFESRLAPRLLAALQAAWFLGPVLAHNGVVSQVYPTTINSSGILPYGAVIANNLADGLYDIADVINVTDPDADGDTHSNYALDTTTTFPLTLAAVIPVYNHSDDILSGSALVANTASLWWGYVVVVVDTSSFFEAIHESAMNDNRYFILSATSVDGESMGVLFDTSYGDGDANQLYRAQYQVTMAINLSSTATASSRNREASLVCWVPQRVSYMRPLSIALVLCIPVAVAGLGLLSPMFYEMFLQKWLEKRRRLGAAPTKGPLAAAIIGISGFDLIWRHQPRLVPSTLAMFEARLTAHAKLNGGFVTTISSRRACIVICRDPSALLKTCKQVVESFHAEPMLVSLFTNTNPNSSVAGDASTYSGGSDSGGGAKSTENPTTSASRTHTPSTVTQIALSVMIVAHWCDDVKAKWQATDNTVNYDGTDITLLRRLFQYARPNSIVITQSLATRLTPLSSPSSNGVNNALPSAPHSDEDYVVELFVQAKLRNQTASRRNTRQGRGAPNAGRPVSTPHQLYSVTYPANPVVLKPSLVVALVNSTGGIPSVEYNPLNALGGHHGATTSQGAGGATSDGEVAIGGRSGGSRRVRRFSALSTGVDLVETGSSSKDHDGTLRYTLRDILQPSVPKVLNELFEEVYMSLTTFSANAVPYPKMAHLCFHYYRALKLLCHPFAPAERLSLQRRLLMAFGVPETNFFEQLAVRCALRYAQKRTEEAEKSAGSGGDVNDEADNEMKGGSSSSSSD